MRSQVVVERDDGWLVLPLEGLQAEVLLEDCWLVVSDDDDEAHVGVPDELEELARAVVADRAAVVEALVSPEGRLEVTFTDDRVLAVSHLEDVEAWEIRGPGDVNVVCPPGGGEPSIWDATSPTQTIRPGDPLPAELAEMIESFGIPMPTGEFELRRSRGRRASFQLRPPNPKGGDQ